jgi:hypothetical protein
MNFFSPGGGGMPSPLTPQIAQQQAAAYPSPFANMMQNMGDPNSQLFGMMMGAGGALLDYGQPQVRAGDTSIAGAMSSGIGGMLGGLQAQKAQAREDKINAMLEDVSRQQMGLLAPQPRDPNMPAISAQQPMPPQPGGGMMAPAPVQPNPLSDTTRLMQPGMGGGMGGGPMMPGIY